MSHSLALALAAFLASMVPPGLLAQSGTYVADPAPGCSRANPAVLSVLTNPDLGGVARCVVDHLTPNTVSSALLIGLTPVQLPLDPFGAPGCTLRVDPSPDAFPMTLLSGMDRSILDLPIPNLPGFVGASVEVQAVLGVPGINALGADLSNSGRLTLGLRNVLPVTSGLVAHFDATDPRGDSTLPLDGEPMSFWRDLSTITLDALASPAAPVFRRAALNGRPAVDFSQRNDDGFQTTDSDSLDGPDWTVFVVGQDPTTALFSMAVKDTIQQEILVFARPGRNVRSFHHTSAGNFFELAHQTSAMAGQPFISETSFNQAVTAITNTFDGVPTTSLGSFAGNPTPYPNAIDRAIHIGRRGNVLFENGAGLISEILLFNRILSNSENNAVGSYLATKYSLVTAYP